MQTRPAEPGSRSFANTQKEERTIVLLLLHSPNPGSEPLSALTFVVASLVHGSYFFFFTVCSQQNQPAAGFYPSQQLVLGLDEPR